MVIIWLDLSPGWHWATGNKLLHFSRALRPPALLHSRWLRVEACFTFTIMNHYKLFLVFCCTSCRIVGFCHKYIPCLHGNSFNSPDTVSIIPLWLLWPERRENNVQRILITQRLIQTKEGGFRSQSIILIITIIIIIIIIRRDSFSFIATKQGGSGFQYTSTFHIHVLLR